MEGRKDDSEKVRIELISSEFIFALATVLTFGAKKYDDRNWEKGMKWSRVFGALMRHLWAWWAGVGPTCVNFAFGVLDEETKFSHLWHAACCLMFLVSYEQRLIGEDDRPQRPMIPLKMPIQSPDGALYAQRDNSHLDPLGR